MTGEHYDAFIREAFLDPIRSVLIIDDDYPTFEEVLEQGATDRRGENNHAAKSWRRHSDRISRVIRSFRQRTPPLLVDIHDGSNVSPQRETEAASHLHQCDLLVLDYELDKAKQNDGTRAVEILRKVSSNYHFNLVIIYTREQLGKAFNTVRWGLIDCSSDSLSEQEIVDSKGLILEGEVSREGFEVKLTDAVGTEQYFYSRKSPKYLREMIKGHPLYAAYVAAADDVGWENEQKKLVLRYLLKDLEKKNGVSLSRKPCINDLQWSSGGINWVKTNSAFVAFSNKSNEDDLLSEVHKALCDWRPRPSRLFLNKIRSEMDEYGVAAQSWLLSRHHALAHWYDRLLRADGTMERRWRIKESVELHSDRLMAVVRPRLDDFVMRLVEEERNVGDASVLCKEHFGVDLSDEETTKFAARQHNALVCSKKEPEGWHLTTGHVFSICDDTWVCVSPACDMVPSQLSKVVKESFGTNLPFIAVKLQRISNNKVPPDVNSNRYIFLERSSDIEGYCFNDPSKDNSSPEWQIFYAKDEGKFSGENFEFVVLRNRLRGDKLIVECHDAKVFCQIRYEYALNLVHKLGVSVTRIGLDFYDGTRL